MITPSEWHPYFAWHPVRLMTTDKWVWLCWVMHKYCENNAWGGEQWTDHYYLTRAEFIAEKLKS